MNDTKGRDFMEDFIVIAANLSKKESLSNVPKDEASLISYLQKMYG
jgi:hypothetical protein